MYYNIYIINRTNVRKVMYILCHVETKRRVKVNKRIKLKQFRIGIDLTQEQMAAKLGVPKPSYIAIENGLRNGNHIFWSKFQTVFKIKDKDMWEFQKGGTSCTKE